MKLRELIACAMCLRTTRDWRQVSLQVGGVAVFSAKCCRACAVEVEDVVAQLARETRAGAA